MLEVKERVNLIVKRFFHSKKDLCEKLNVTTVTLFYWCQNDSIPPKQVQKIMELCPALNYDWLANGEGPMMKVEPEERNWKPIPFYENVVVTCGVVELGEQNEDVHYVNMPGVDAQFLMRASGDSMSPTIENGDLIGVKEVAPFEGFRSGQPYLIITYDAHCMVKYVSDPGADVPYLELSSENPDYVMLPGEKKLEKESVIKILKVTFVGKMKPF